MADSRNMGAIALALARRPPTLVADRDMGRASVALLVRDGATGTDILFIRRAECEGDPWSGHLAFPGGRMEPADAGPRETAERETREEIGLDLTAARPLGRLDDVVTANQTIVVSGFAYAVHGPARFELSDEVAQAFWVSLDNLQDPERHVEQTFRPYGGQPQLYPAIDLLGPDHPLLWGVTYRFTARLLQVLDRPIPSPPDPIPPPRCRR